jgi:hypothetical protein
VLSLPILARLDQRLVSKVRCGFRRPLLVAGRMALRQGTRLPGLMPITLIRGQLRSGKDELQYPQAES